MYYELRLWNRTKENPEGKCFQVAYYSNEVLGLEQFNDCVERAKDWHKLFEAEKISVDKRPFANFIQLCKRGDTWLDEVAIWEHQHEMA